jgi:hypothetical protein
VEGKKGGVDEGSHKSACFLQWKSRIAPQAPLKPIASVIDLLPTLASLSGIPLKTQHPLDGLDLAPLLLQKVSTLPERSLFTAWGRSATIRTARWRVANGELFDLQAEPKQTKPCAGEHPEVLQKLTAELVAWRESTGFRNGGGGAGVDPRPIDVGFPEYPWTWLPARDGTPHGGLQRSSSAPNSSYFTQWKNADGYVTWEVNVVTAGTYVVEMEYTCAPASVGTTLEVSCGEAVLPFQLKEAWDPALYTNQDTIPRPSGESKLKEFKLLSLGKLALSPGKQTLTVKAKPGPGAPAMDLFAMHLSLEKQGK